MSDIQVDLTNCDREPIHLLSAIQPIGFLLCMTADWLVARASANVIDHLGQAVDDIIGLPATEIFAVEALHDLRNRLTGIQGPDAVERVLGIACIAARPRDLYDCALHFSGEHIVIELEPNRREDYVDSASVIRSMMARLDQPSDLAGYFKTGARQLRALTGFDRVMVYRFDRDGSGEVVGEAARHDIGSFLGLHYPASDIPQQARALYLRTPFRIITDLAAEPVPILPARDAIGAPLDLSLSVMRSVSPIHIEYLKNMGVGASMSVSIIIEGKLWGLFACHHYSPLCPSFQKRTIAELFGQMFALKLESRDRQEAAAYENNARRATDRLMASVANDVTLLDNPEWVGETLRAIIPCDGIGIWIGAKAACGGSAPPLDALPVIARRFNALAAGRVFSTDHLAEIVPGADAYAAQAAGVLSIPISRSPRDYVLLFREERVRQARWAGDPHKPASYGPNGARLTPRESFAEWRQEVRNRSEPFSAAEQRVAETLRVSMIEVVLRLSDAAETERQTAAERQELLIAELNHRVRNILALIRGLVRQSRDSKARAVDYIALLEGRIEALARAHDQITQDNWAPALLRALIETEAAAYLGGRRERVEIEGEAVLLDPAAFSTMALVIHELVTNSAKYGGLSDSGGVRVTWARDDAGDLIIDWREFGGPIVTPPLRQGFGTTIIQRSVPYDLKGKAEVWYKPAGFEAQFSIPARYVSQPAANLSQTGTAPRAAAVTDSTAPLIGKVLLVEDSLIIAMDAEDILMELGAVEVRTVSTVAQALESLAQEKPSVAVLDVNLGEENSFPIADALKAAGVRYVFATGYGDQLRLPDAHAGTPTVKKPYTAASLSRVLEGG
ncbi:HWE histidine kinase domain-containing protein [Acidisoma silvae]|uniref:histidine kinase n=1 Tax=Acidisoma silvae TaxID=2802396 RepID=A0A963YUN2_9PROT|nr:HWE histidine kinase domain-containing protein [Acidisoma silvae]MCB8876623.1 GAF domain-containing protein [Acidisoma silvae]